MPTPVSVRIIRKRLLSKYSYEEKLDAVLRVTEDGMSLKDSAKILEHRKNMLDAGLCVTTNVSG